MKNNSQNILRKAQLKVAAARLRRVKRFQPGTIRLFGRCFHYVDGPSFLSAFWEIFVQEIYDFTTANPEPVFVDAGANVGLASCYLLQKYTNAKIIAFEPDPAIADCFERNTAKYGSQIDLHRVALGDCEKIATFYQEGGDSGSLVDDSNGTGLAVSLRKLSSYLPDRVDFLKLDVEGAELDVIRDCAPLLDRVERLFVEIHCYEGDQQENLQVLEVLRQTGFRCFPVTPYSLFDRYETSEGSSKLDLAMNVFALRAA